MIHDSVVADTVPSGDVIGMVAPILERFLEMARNAARAIAEAAQSRAGGSVSSSGRRGKT